MNRQHPRRQRASMFVLGGNPLPLADTPGQEDFPSEALELAPVAEDSPVSAVPVVGDAAVDAAIRWDRSAAAEPYQIDVTREFDDTVRMGNSLSAAVRLELLAAGMREDLLDGQTPRDPVSGAELDPVDGLPVPAEGDWETVADLMAEVAPRRYAAARPTPDEALAAHAAEAFHPGWEEEAQASLEAAVQEAAARRDDAAPSRIYNWTSRHDARSLDYGVRGQLRAPAPLMDRAWAHGPILDQGECPPLSLHDASGCTGHAGVNAANVLALADPHHPAGGELYGHDDAMRLYERAQELDDVPGESYPGTSVLALMKAGQELGLWSEYLWSFGTRDVAQTLLQVGPVIIGVPMLEGMAKPGPDGVVALTGAELGGHCMCLFAIRMTVAGKAGPWFGALQTWGESVGDHGVIWIHHKDLARLLHGTGEAAVPLATPGR